MRLEISRIKGNGRRSGHWRRGPRKRFRGHASLRVATMMMMTTPTARVAVIIVVVVFGGCGGAGRGADGVPKRAELAQETRIRFVGVEVKRIFERWRQIAA